MNEIALIIGSGACARQMAETLMQSGISVQITGAQTSGSSPLSIPSSPDAGDALDIPEGARIRALTGSAGRFTVEWDIDGRRIRRHVHHIIVAEDTQTRANGSLYGIQAGPYALPLSAFAALLRPDSEKAGILESISRVAFLTGLFHESHPLTAEAVMRAALTLQRDHGVQAYIFTGNLKVAGAGLEALSRHAKAAGVVFIKATDIPPEIVQADDGSITLTYTDEILRKPSGLQPDLTVFDETFLPSPALNPLAQMFALETGPDGFLQADNVHRLPTFTNRKGVQVIGPARGVSPPSRMGAEIAHTALSVLRKKDPGADTEGKARIETGKCIRCLTCVRVCPHRAVELAPRPVIAAAACEGCGICVAECPCHAIAFEPLPYKEVPAAPEPIPHTDGDAVGTSEFTATVTVFCCGRSAVPARRTAIAMGGGLAGNFSFIEVPCAGAVASLDLMDALHRGADGVLVLGCHPDNCHSQRGSLRARERLAAIESLLPRLGFARERVAFQGLAANMGAEFSQILREFSKQLESLGPNWLKKSSGR